MITRATAADAAVIAQLAVQLWPGHSVAELTEEFHTFLQDAACALFLAHANGQPVGFAQCQLRHDYVEGTDSSPVGYLEGIFVAKAYRQQGYARQLLTACEQWAKAQGCTEFASDCELCNEDSLHFHLQVGFAEANRIICFKKSL